jgi:hypothetical protein
MTSFAPYPHTTATFEFPAEYIPTTTTDYSTPIVSLPPFDGQMAGYKDPSIQDEMIYSPAQISDEMHSIPRLSTASESGASVQSTSSSAIPSPHLYPQHPDLAWGLLRSNSLQENDFRSPQQEFLYQTPQTTEADHKMMPFISEFLY